MVVAARPGKYLRHAEADIKGRSRDWAGSRPTDIVSRVAVCALGIRSDDHAPAGVVVDAGTSVAPAEHCKAPVSWSKAKKSLSLSWSP
jgi:hypothetical protein